MPNPTVDSVAPNGVVSLHDAPGGAMTDESFDALFPADGTTQVTAPVQPAAPANGNTPAASAAVTQPQNTPSGQPTQPFLKGEKSVYNSAEDAIKGIDQKDALIEQLRQRYALTTGLDPITNKPVGPASAPQPVDDYSQNSEKYLADLYKAAQQGPEAYSAVQQKFILDTLKPLQPVMRNTVRQQAIEEVSKEIPQAAQIINSPEFQKTLDRVPELKSAIEAAATDHRFYSRLPELLKMAVWTSQGLQLPEILKANAAPKPTPTQTPAPRPTLQTPSSMPTQQTTSPNFKSHAGIKSIVEQMEAAGHKLEF